MMCPSAARRWSEHLTIASEISRRRGHTGSQQPSFRRCAPGWAHIIEDGKRRHHAPSPRGTRHGRHITAALWTLPEGVAVHRGTRYPGGHRDRLRLTEEGAYVRDTLLIVSGTARCHVGDEEAAVLSAGLSPGVRRTQVRCCRDLETTMPSSKPCPRCHRWGCRVRSDGFPMPLTHRGWHSRKPDDRAPAAAR